MKAVFAPRPDATCLVFATAFAEDVFTPFASKGLAIEGLSIAGLASEGLPVAGVASEGGVSQKLLAQEGLAPEGELAHEGVITSRRPIPKLSL